MITRILPIRVMVTILCLMAMIVPARAEVLATFYSHDFDGAYFPHAFIRLQGTIDETGEKIDTNYGFTAKNTSPRILFGSVLHEVTTSKPKYVGNSEPHFTIRLDDAGYNKLMAHVGEWRDIEGKGYNLKRRNCIHFVMEAAAMFGLAVNRESKFFRKPKSFLLEVKGLNEGLEIIESAATQPVESSEPSEQDQIASKPIE